MKVWGCKDGDVAKHEDAIEAGIIASTGYSSAAEYFASVDHEDATEAGIIASTGHSSTAEYYASGDHGVATKAGLTKAQQKDGKKIHDHHSFLFL